MGDWWTGPEGSQGYGGSGRLEHRDSWGREGSLEQWDC